MGGSISKWPIWLLVLQMKEVLSGVQNAASKAKIQAERASQYSIFLFSEDASPKLSEVMSLLSPKLLIPFLQVKLIIFF